LTSIIGYSKNLSDVISYNKWLIKFICKSQPIKGARTASFGIIGHQICKWEWNFYKNEITGTQTSFPTNIGAKLSFVPSFLFPERLQSAATYLFTAPTCTTTIITLQPCALNAEFQHFILRFNKIFLLCGFYSFWKRG